MSHVSRNQALASHSYSGVSGAGGAWYAGEPIPVHHEPIEPASQLYVEPVEPWQRSGPVEDRLVEAGRKSDWPSAVFLAGPVILALLWVKWMVS